MTSIEYQGYVIRPSPLELTEGGWDTRLLISRDTGSMIHFQRYSASNVWPTEEKAVQHCAEFGRLIIDGELPDLTPP